MSRNRSRKILLFGDVEGTPDLLRSLGSSNIAGIVGAGNRPHYVSGLRDIAKNLGVPFFVQPAQGDAAFPIFLSQISGVKPDLAICYSYSMLLQPEILAVVDGNAVNVHASLLPRNRGPNPVQWAIIHGEAETGVTLHCLNDRFDAGDIIAQRPVPIAFEDTWVDLSRKLDEVARSLLQDELPAVLEGCHNRRPQGERGVSNNPRLKPESPRIDFSSMQDIQIYNLIRAQVRPLAGAYVVRDGEIIRFPDFVPYADIPALRAAWATESSPS